MVKRSISNLDLLKVIDENRNNTYYGCDQKWYSTEWQRKSGCGPTTACNILMYLELSKISTGLEIKESSKEFALLLMQEAWHYITPTEKGIPTTKMFCEDILAYIESKGLHVSCNAIDVPKEVGLRPKLRNILSFIEHAMVKDTPVAFLNLCSGKVEKLDDWHWVTIVALEYDERCNEAYVTIVDGGLIKKIDIELWYSTTTLGGGFIYFTVAEANMG